MDKLTISAVINGNQYEIGFNMPDYLQTKTDKGKEEYKLYFHDHLNKCVKVINNALEKTI